MTYTLDELTDFDARIKKGVDPQRYDYVCEQKLDGTAISLIYKNGQFHQAITRGDGYTGDDITQNAQTIQNIPPHIKRLKNRPIPNHIEVRGEVYMDKKTFEKINLQRKEEDLPVYANARNFAAGSLKMIDKNRVAARKLRCLCYYFFSETLAVQTHVETLEYLDAWGFDVMKNYQRCKNIHEVSDYIESWRRKRLELPVHTDGIVIKVNLLSQRTRLGNTAKSPRWAMAFKYPSEEIGTILKDIVYHVGRTGAITPVALLEPVWLGGTKVQRASLHNFEEVQRLQLCVGDRVFVEKGGDIIPKITGIDPQYRRTRTLSPVEIPHRCPCCRTLLVREAEEAVRYCPNVLGCSAQILEKLAHFASRKAMNIVALGQETLRGLYDIGLVRDIVDIYTLKEEDLLSATLKGKGEKERRMHAKSVNKLLQGISASKQQGLASVLFGLGIRHIGKTTAQKLARHFKDIQSLMSASYDSLLEIEDIGEKAANALRHYFENEDNKDRMEKLKKSGVKMSIDAPIAPQASPLSQKRIVISGRFSHRSREEMKAHVESLGAVCLGSVSSKIDFLLCGENAGEAKRKKAETLGILIINEKELAQMLAP